jgi:hypothetical protein
MMSHLWRGLRGVAVLALWLSAVGSEFSRAQPQPQPEDPSPEEQLVIELVNRARHNPPLFDTVFGLGGVLTNPVPVLPQPPLAVNGRLTGSASFHAQEMADLDYFDHQSPDGDWPNDLARQAGYLLPPLFPVGANNIESIAAGTTTPLQTVRLLLIDEGIEPPGHRIHLLGMEAFFAAHDEIGAGRGFDDASTFGTYWAIHTAHDTEVTRKFVTGVVYDDGIVPAVPADHLYTPGEGRAGVLVQALDPVTGTEVARANTMSSGGYSLSVPLGATGSTYDILFSGGSLAAPVIHRSVSVGTLAAPLNAKVDSISRWNQAGGPNPFSWNSTGNWFGGVPNGVGSTAALVSSTAAAVTVQPTGVTIGHLKLQSASGFTVGGASANDLTFDVASGEATISVLGAGQHTVDADVHIRDGLNVSIDPNGSLRFTGGRLTNHGQTLTKLGAGTLHLDNQFTFEPGSRLLALEGTTNINVDSGANPLSLIVDNSNTRVNLNSSQHFDSLMIAQGRVEVSRGGNKVISIGSLTFGDSAMMIVPEPGTIALLGVAVLLVAVIGISRRRSVVRTD